MDKNSIYFKFSIINKEIAKTRWIIQTTFAIYRASIDTDTIGLNVLDHIQLQNNLGIIIA